MLMKQKISGTANSETALDQRQLFAIGLEHVRRLSRKLWTDHNIHDPGITTLELLCYALTDLAYRAKFPIQDLLATETENGRNMAGQFFTARQVLPNRPLTSNDYRKLLIDMAGVKNAWIAPADERYYASPVSGKLSREPGADRLCEVKLRGLYRVLIEPDENVTSEAQRIELAAAAMSLLQANRNLCEDFTGVTMVEDRYFSLCAELELEPGADQSDVAAKLVFEVGNYLSPPVINHSLSEMLDRKHADGSPYTAAEIFEGPLLLHGFIEDADLEDSKLRTEIFLSDIISVIMDIAGVRAVRDIIVNELSGADGNYTATAPVDKWRLTVASGCRPRLDEKRVQLTFYKRNMPMTADAQKVGAAVQSLRNAQQSKLDTPSAEDLAIPQGRFRPTREYLSFQQHFPVLYGLSEQGLPATASPRRKALALQLKGYLLFFDQMMANYFAQLSGVRELFSHKQGVEHTYFAQRVDSFREADRIYMGVTDSTLHDLLEDKPAALKRRSRFLDHLLSRFAEDFHHYVSIMHSLFGANAEGMAAEKCSFIHRYPKIAARRGLGCNYTLRAHRAKWNSFNVSGLEYRLAHLLGIANFSRRNLGKAPYEMYSELDRTPGGEFRWRIKHPASGKIMLSSSMHYANLEAAHAEMDQAINAALSPSGYTPRQSNDGRHYFNIVNAKGEVIARRIEYFSTAAEMKAAMDELMTTLRHYYSGEGMYVIENILLRPRSESDPVMDTCIDPDCGDCAGADPYSYRLHIVLPAYAGRFRNTDFRRYVEETIRLETPAHILPKICWVSRRGMERVEQAYREWVSPGTASSTGKCRSSIRPLLNALYATHNVYPHHPLQGCGEGKTPFILNRTALDGETAISPSTPPNHRSNCNE